MLYNIFIIKFSNAYIFSTKKVVSFFCTRSVRCEWLIMQKVNYFFCFQLAFKFIFLNKLAEGFMLLVIVLCTTSAGNSLAARVSPLSPNFYALTYFVLCLPASSSHIIFLWKLIFTLSAYLTIWTTVCSY